MNKEGDEKESAAKKLCPSVGGHPKPLLSEIGKRISRSERTPKHIESTTKKPNRIPRFERHFETTIKYL